jgi:hypothetical protein
MIDKQQVKKGSVLQVSKLSERFTGCIVIVDEVRSWGVTCYIPYVDGSTIPLRVSWDDVAYIGEAYWTWSEESTDAKQ